jgi:hypothetical protein
MLKDETRGEILKFKIHRSKSKETSKFSLVALSSRFLVSYFLLAKV